MLSDSDNSANALLSFASMGFLLALLLFNALEMPHFIPHFYGNEMFMCMCACTVCIYAIKAFNKNKESFVFRMIPFHLMLLLVLFLQHNITHFMAVVVVFPSYSMPLCQW